MKREVKIFSTFSALLFVWLLFTFSLDPFSILLGVFFSFIISLLTYNFFIEKEKSFKTGFFPLLGFLFVYSGVLLWEIYLASIVLVYQVVTMRINPGLIKVPTGLESDFAQALLASSVTLTPGTVAIEAEKDYLYVHWLAVDTLDPVKAAHKIKGNYEKQIGRIFH